MSKKKNIFDIKLDPEEQEIEDTLPEAGEDLPVTANLAEEIALAREAASNYFRKNIKINIRLSSYDVEHLRRIAAKEGLPYQTLIASILHKYAAEHI